MASSAPSLPRRLATVLLAASLVLAMGGATALVLQPSSALAEPLSKTPADITVKPGETVSKTFDDLLIGSAEARPPGPNGCRTDPAFSLTCAAVRIKLTTLLPGYLMRISTTWQSVDALGTSVPDVDTYLYYEPSAAFAYEEVGGVGSAMPEVITIKTPKQTEYDLVVGAYAGPIQGFSVTVDYVNVISERPTPGITPDITLTPKAAPFVRSYTSALAGANGYPALYPVVTVKPDACRNNPSQDALCDVYRLRLNRSTAKGALNFIVIELTWDAVYAPPLVAVAVALNESQVPNLDMFIWNTADHVLERASVGGQGDSMPERIAFVATQDEYDLVIQSGLGAAAGYKLTATLSDEIFDKPFELLDPLTGLPVDTSGGGADEDFGELPGELPDLSGLPDLPLQDVDTDPQISGIGLGTSEQFASEDLLRLGRAAARNTAAVSEPPSTAALVAALVVLPLAVLLAGVGLLRRRRNVLI